MSEPNEIDYPYEDYLRPDFTIRGSFAYLAPEPPDSGVLWRLQRLFGESQISALREALSEAESIIDDTLDEDEANRDALWFKHEVWVPRIGFDYMPARSPARLFQECFDFYGGVAGVPDQKLFAAVGLWCYGEFSSHFVAGRSDAAFRMLNQAALALAEAEFYRGRDAADQKRGSELAARNRAAAAKRHEANIENKKRGLEIWKSRDWRVQADAEREISSECNVIQAVAGRWIREFKRAAPTNPAAQSKDSASRDP